MVEVSFYILVALFIASNIFWAMLCLKLTNRLMSRNYAEYAQATKKPVRLKQEPLDMSDPVAEGNAKTMNALMGVL